MRTKERRAAAADEGIAQESPHPDVSHLVTVDGAPVENIYVEKQYRLLTDPLESSWAGPDGKGVFVTLTNVGLFYADRNPALVPDFLLSVGVSYPDDLLHKEHRSYFVWLYGKGPDVVGEIVSDRRGGEDTLKLRQYAALGIRYYFIYDPGDLLRGGVLRLYGLHPEGYRLLPDNTLNGLGLRLSLWHGTFAQAEQQWLRWCDKNGKLLPTGQEKAGREKRRAEAAKRRAAREKQRADAEKQRAKGLAKRLKRLEEEMRAAGMEPPP